MSSNIQKPKKNYGQASLNIFFIAMVLRLLILLIDLVMNNFNETNSYFSNSYELIWNYSGDLWKIILFIILDVLVTIGTFLGIIGIIHDKSKRKAIFGLLYNVTAVLVYYLGMIIAQAHYLSIIYLR